MQTEIKTDRRADRLTDGCVVLGCTAVFGRTTTNLNQTAKTVLRILSTISLMELADGDKEFCSSSVVDTGKCMSPAEALGQSGSSWLFFSLKIMFIMMCMVIGCGFFWMRRRRIQAEGQLENGEQHGGTAILDEVGSEAGETDSQLRARYLRDPMSEVSDPELWQPISVEMVVKNPTAMCRWLQQVSPMAHTLPQ